MRHLINLLIVVLVLVLTGGLALSALPKIRAAAARTQCQNNLKQIGLGLHNSYDTYGTFPPATIPNDALTCCQRLSWQVDLVSFVEQMRLVIDRTKGWDAEENRIPMTLHFSGPEDEQGTLGPLGELKFLRCPANPAVAAPDSPGLSDYVGISGIGSDAAELPICYPGIGFFGCPRQTKREDVTDGLASTIMVMETNSANGPWTAGGFPTTRGLDPAAGRYLGAGGQFGGDHRSCKGWFSPTKTVLTNVAFADGSVRGFSDSVSPEVLEALVTIAGGENIGPTGE